MLCTYLFIEVINGYITNIHIYKKTITSITKVKANQDIYLLKAVKDWLVGRTYTALVIE